MRAGGFLFTSSPFLHPNLARDGKINSFSALPSQAKPSASRRMKLIHNIAIVVATALFTLTGCNKAPDEKTAIANFKTEIESTTKWMEEKQKDAGADPVKGTAVVGEIVAKFKSIKTDGLPADLKAAWGEMAGVMTEFGEVFKGLPKVDPAKPEDAMKAFGEIGPKMMAIEEKGKPIAKKLEELGKKYGIDMSKVGPGSK